jgi:hypothetical protein
VSAPLSSCLKSDPARSGAAALASISAGDGVPATVREVLELSGLEDIRTVDEGTVLVIARTLGYDALAMEGGYDDLPDVRLPVLVALREGERVAYGVLHRFDESCAVVGDPRTGEVTPWTRDRFCTEWTGSVVQVTPIAEERRALSTRLVDARDPWKRGQRALGWVPPYGRRVAMLVGWVAVAGVAVVAPRESALDAPVTVLVAVACATSLWAWLASDACARCSRAKQRAGELPLAIAGTFLYAALLLAPFLSAPRAWIGVALAAALGGHGALVVELARAKVGCPACLLVAASVVGASAVSIARRDVALPVFAATALLVMVGLTALLPGARARSARISRSTAEELAHTVSAEPNPSKRVRVIAFKRAGCPACAFFEAAVKPALLATFADAIALDERDLGELPADAPLVLVLGSRRALFIGLPAGDAIEPILAAVRDALGEEATSGELMVHVRPT